MAITIWVQLSYSPPGRPNKSLKTCKFKVCRFFVFPHSPGDRGLITAADPGNAFRGRTDTTLHYTTPPFLSAQQPETRHLPPRSTIGAKRPAASRQFRAGSCEVGRESVPATPAANDPDDRPPGRRASRVW